MSQARLTKLANAMQTNGLQVLAINPGPTLTYLTGLHFHLMERPTVLLFRPGKDAVLVLPELEAGKLSGLEFPLQAYPYGENPAGWAEVFQRAGQSLGILDQKIGVEPNRFRFLEMNLLQNAFPQAGFTSAEEVTNGLRMLKDAQEVAAMREAVQIAQKAFKNTLPLIHAGVTEREIATELVLQLLHAGSDSEMPFSPIIAGGPNSAKPHAIPTDRKLSAGDMLVIDWGATYQGYISDLTRTVAIGPVDPEMEKIYSIVKAANAAGCKASQPGIPAGKIDQITRTVIDQSGYGTYFRHRTGHGIGMEGHEPPYIFGENAQILMPGMAYTVEPGIYLPDRGGVRIEDNVVITADGAEILSDLSRELIVLP